MSNFSRFLSLDIPSQTPKVSTSKTTGVVHNGRIIVTHSYMYLITVGPFECTRVHQLQSVVHLTVLYWVTTGNLVHQPEQPYRSEVWFWQSTPVTHTVSTEGSSTPVPGLERNPFWGKIWRLKGKFYFCFFLKNLPRHWSFTMVGNPIDKRIWRNSWNKISTLIIHLPLLTLKKSGILGVGIWFLSSKQ